MVVTGCLCCFVFFIVYIFVCGGVCLFVCLGVLLPCSNRFCLVTAMIS